MVQRVTEQHWSVRRAAEAHGVSERTVRKWMARHRDEGDAGLVDRSSRPHTSPRATPPEKAELVATLRNQGLTGDGICDVLRVARSTVFRILGRLGFSKLKSLEPAEPPRRYEWERPGDLLHVDIKKLGRFNAVGHRITGERGTRSRGAGWEFVHVCIDDHSRLSYVEVLDDEKSKTAADFLKRALRWFSTHGITARRLISDNGGCYRGSRFRRVCEQRRIRHIFTKPYTPRTNGKAERFIKTMCAEWAYARPYENHFYRRQALTGWLRHYNERRPHSSLGRQPPISRIRAAG